ncbi:MAG: MATE family efflux transporter [Bryobacter sp.]
MIDTLKKALSGNYHHDFTEGSLKQAILLLAIPMVLELSMESLFAIVDVFWVARLGSDAVTIVGLTESMLAILYAVAMGLCAGAGAFVARRIGEKDAEGAAAAAGQSILLTIALSVIVGLVAGHYAKDLLALMTPETRITDLGANYAKITFGASYAVLFLFVINAIFRGAGDAAIAMRVLWIANALNLVLDPCLIFGWGPFPALGLEGSAVATATGRTVGVGYQLWCLTRPGGRFQLHWRHMRPEPELLRGIWKVSFPGMFQYFVATASWVALARIVAQFGSVATAGYTIAIRIIVMTIMPSWGLGGAAATLVGQNLGAGKPDRSERATWLCGFYNMVFLGLVSVVFIAYAEPLIRIFSQEEAVVNVGKEALRLISYGYLLYAYGMVLVQAFNGAGDTVTPTVINVICYWLFQIPLAYWLAHGLGYGPSGVFWAVTIAECIIALAGIVMFRRGSWKQVKV